MNKKELGVVALLILLMFGWSWFDAQFLKPLYPTPPAPEKVVETAGAVEAVPATVVGTNAPALPPPAVLASNIQAIVAAPENPIEAAPQVDAEITVLSNDVLDLRISNFGAGVVGATLKEFDDELADKRNNTGRKISLDFSRNPALSYHLGGLDRNTRFEQVSVDGRSVVYEVALYQGVRFRRSLQLGDGYALDVRDEWVNDLAMDVPVAEQRIFLGRMFPLANVSQKFGPYLGIDARHTDGTRHYVNKIAKWARKAEGVHEERIKESFDWFAVKNKFFCQVLTIPEGEHWLGGRELLLFTAKGNSRDVPVGFVEAGAVLAGDRIPAQTTVLRKMVYYVGPTEMPHLKALGQQQEEVMDFRLWSFFNPIGKLLMSGLNGIHALIPNWGIAIILLTVVVRLLFWPLTHKGTESMKRMQELAPQMKALKEKYKDNPQKLNREMGNFYRENKVNPMAGCMPMLVQIPVFIALYGVLRVAVELRFAEFLWIKDLSEPENIMGWLNILPLTMGGTMLIQQKMAPGTMDPQQKKIMMMMPVIFLFICYGMPAGLLLYWTTSNILSIVQQVMIKRKQTATPAPTPAVAAGPAKPKKKG